ncbi:hypothetical protein VB796_08865 [Arcicella sp. LKC2W]|uniref:hypothetical protein n=1 Tax=Arcicella sp. LKC2W TaxID=2984198 RepID=UPI002B1FD17C|nr:hypothetical protein [Arcicella sp. LKC2W]MEA5459146.1 hypothetical protein [Arcicella sp. LKC2W]
MRKLILLVLLSTTIILNSFSQQNFVKGYIVTNTGDTLQGNIDNKDWLKNPASISFIHNINNKIERKNPLQIKSFYVSDNNELYESHKVSIDLSPYEDKKILEAGITTETNFVVPDTTLFLRILVKGSATLYSFTDKDKKQHFYFSKKGVNTVEELILQKSVFFKNGVKYLGENKLYKTQLTFLNECDITQTYPMLAFTADDLERFFKKYNQCVGDKTVVSEKKGKSSTEISIMAGISSTTIKQNYFTETTQDIYPIVGIGLDYVIPRNRNRWRIGVETWLQSAGQRNKTYTSFVKINLLFKYQILANQGVRPYVAAGYGFGKLLKSDNFSSISNFFINTTGFLAGFGLTKNRWAFEIRAEKMADMMNWLYIAQDAYNYNVFLKYQIR